MASIKEVANDAGVSVATVSYVINKNKYVSPELTQRVLESIQKLNYRCNPVARSLRNKKTKTLGVVLQNIRNIFFPQLLSGLEDYTRNHGYNLLFFNTYNDIEVERNDIISLSNMWVDGIILDTCVDKEKAAEYVKFLDSTRSGKKTPVVLLERSLGSGEYPAVMVDNYAGAYEATCHLIERGKKNILHIAGYREWNMTYDRMEGYVKAMRDKGLAQNISIRYGGLKPQVGYDIMKEILIQGSPVEAVFAANDQMAIGAMKAIKEFGLTVPENIAVVGFDNIFVSSLIETPLTTVNVPKYNMGNSAARLAIELVEDPNAKCESIILPTNLIVRQSTDLRGEKNWDLYGW